MYEGQGWSTSRAVELSAKDLGVDPARAANAMALKSGKVAIASESSDDECTYGTDLICNRKNGEQEMHDVNTRSILHDALMTLSDKERHVMQKCFLDYDEMDFTTYAAEFGGARQTAGKHAFNGKAKLAAYFLEHGFSLDDLMEL